VSRLGLFLKTIIVGHGLSVTTLDQSSAHYSLSYLVGTIMVVLGIVFMALALKELSRYIQIHNERIVSYVVL